MDISTWLSYLVVTLICVATPGPGIILAISNSIKFGWKRVIFSSFGNILGNFIVSSLTMVGLGTLLKTSISLFFIFKMIGGGYLIYLGVKQWNSKINIFEATKEEPHTK